MAKQSDSGYRVEKNGRVHRTDQHGCKGGRYIVKKPGGTREPVQVPVGAVNVEEVTK